MPVPRNRHSNARKNTRRAHHAKKAIHTRKCQNCGVAVLPHHLCQACGYYKKELIIQKAEATADDEE